LAIRERRLERLSVVERAAAAMDRGAKLARPPCHGAGWRTEEERH
jgi:hypothetical protein